MAVTKLFEAKQRNAGGNIVSQPSFSDMGEGLVIPFVFELFVLPEKFYLLRSNGGGIELFAVVL